MTHPILSATQITVAQGQQVNSQCHSGYAQKLWFCAKTGHSPQVWRHSHNFLMRVFVTSWCYSSVRCCQCIFTRGQSESKIRCWVSQNIDYYKSENFKSSTCAGCGWAYDFFNWLGPPQPPNDFFLVINDSLVCHSTKNWPKQTSYHLVTLSQI